jgi:Protein of unknown function (DUF995)
MIEPSLLEGKSMRAILGTSIVMALGISRAFAGDLPGTAVPLTTAEAAQIYSGKTALYKGSSFYFAPDGTAKGYYGKPPKGALLGTWVANDNEVCLTSHGFRADDSKPTVNCNKYWRDGKKIWSLWTVHFDNSPVDPHGYWDKETSQYKPGDLVEEQYTALGGP